MCKVQNTAANSAIEYKDLARSICIKCGKNFTNKKGLKQHVIRMHSSKRQAKAGIDDQNRDLVITHEEEDEIGAKDVIESVKIIHVNNATEFSSPLPKRKRIEGNGIEETNQTEMISSLIGDLIDQCSKEIDTNYQCGDCGEISVTEKDLMTHIEKHHRQEDISLCEECGEPVNDETDLNRHMKNHHTQDNDHNKILPAENSQNHVDKSNHQKSGDCQLCRENEKEECVKW